MDLRMSKSKRNDALASGGWVIRLLLTGSLGLNIYLLFFRTPVPDVPPPVVGEAVLETGETPVVEGVQVEAPVDDVAKPVAVVMPTYKHLQLKVKGSIAATFGKALGSEDGDLVSAFYSRIFMWKLDLKKDVRPNDVLTLLYSIGADGQVDIPTATYVSLKNRETYQAYSYRAKGQPWDQFFDARGVEVADRLVNGPIKDYEQVTSLLKDRPTHKGVDFKAPVGTPVLSPFAGKVTRVNWSTRYNGRCIEVRNNDGTLAKFLHLDKVASGIAPGRTVRAGEVLADSGNTGRSTAPHLHYQLERRNGRVLDPFETHDTFQITLDNKDMAKFSLLVEALDSQIAGESPRIGAAALATP